MSFNLLHEGSLVVGDATVDGGDLQDDQVTDASSQDDDKVIDINNRDDLFIWQGRIC